jgi:hypothetical protein
LADVRQDLAYSVRQLARTPAFTAIATLTLALGVGATTAIFSAVRSVVLRPFPFAQPERVVGVTERWQGSEGDVSDGNFVDWHARQTAFDQLAAEQFTDVTLADATSADRLTGALVTRDFFAVFGVLPAGAAHSDPRRMSRCRRRRCALRRPMADSLRRRPARGRQEVRLNGRSRTVIGVMPPWFDPTTSGEQLWVPAAFTRSARRSTTSTTTACSAS